MELPYHLKTLPPDALDVLRYLGTLDDLMAYKDDICEAVGLSDRGFGKVIRRLVTKGYAIMDGMQVYRLTDQGLASVEELAAYDEANPDGERSERVQGESVRRRLALVLPSLVIVGQPVRAYVGVHGLPGFGSSTEIVARLSITHGEPQTPLEVAFDLNAQPVYESFVITPGAYRRLRVRVEVYQLGPNPGDVAVAGGMYVDVDVTADPDHGSAPLLAYGTDISIEQLE